MKLDIASIEPPEFVQAPGIYTERSGYRPEYETIDNKTFEGRRVILDNRQFRNCTFRSCNLVYGGSLYGFVDCEFDDETALSLTGSAARSVALWRSIREHPERRPVVPF